MGTVRVHTRAIRNNHPEQRTDCTGTHNVTIPQPAMPDTPVRQQTPKSPRVPEWAQSQQRQLASPAASPVL